MARADAYTRHAVRDILKEHDRQANSYKNEVDVNRTNQNFSFGMPAEGKSVDDMIMYLDVRCRDIMGGKTMAKNTNVVCEWSVYYPKELCNEIEYERLDKYGRKEKAVRYEAKDPEQCKEYMKKLYEFTCQRYGQENMIGGWVHMDETTPHIQMLFIPDAISRKTGHRTVSSASVLTRGELKKYQQDLQKEVEKVYGKQAKQWVLNGRTQTGETNRQYKARRQKERTIVRREKKLQKDLQDFKEETEYFKDYVVQFLAIASAMTGKKYELKDEDNEIDFDEIINDMRSFANDNIDKGQKAEKYISDYQDLLIQLKKDQEAIKVSRANKDMIDFTKKSERFADALANIQRNASNQQQELSNL